jgi:Outer membrane protein and related peptidoglycan-associated (lipo)proteins
LNLLYPGSIQALSGVNSEDQDDDQASQIFQPKGDCAECRTVDDGRSCHCRQQKCLERSNPECPAAQAADAWHVGGATGRSRCQGQGNQLHQDAAQQENPIAVARRARRNPGDHLGQAEIDLDIQFDYNSDKITTNSMPSVQALGKALSDANLKGSTFVVAGHTDAIGGEAYNQDLSERRADTIKRYLTEKYGINGTDLVAVGYGKTKPKDPNAPMDPVNRRVQVVNMDTKTASK